VGFSKLAMDCTPEKYSPIKDMPCGEKKPTHGPKSPLYNAPMAQKTIYFWNQRGIWDNKGA
jgi:hypothetical protein